MRARSAVGGEAGEHHGVHDAEPRARQHRDDGLGHHRHVDRHPVAGDQAELGQRVGGLAHLGLQFGVGDGAASSTGSPSQWMATRSPLPASTWRSTQL